MAPTSPISVYPAERQAQHNRSVRAKISSISGGMFRELFFRGGGGGGGTIAGDQLRIEAHNGMPTSLLISRSYVRIFFLSQSFCLLLYFPISCISVFSFASPLAFLH